MRDTPSILVSSAGRRNQLMDCFRGAARKLGMNIRILAADMNPAMSPACHAADAAFTVPRCTAPDFHEQIRGICRAEDVRLIIPTIDTELPGYASEQAAYAGIGARLAISSPEVVSLARDKMRFHEFLVANNLPSPRTGEAIALNGASLAALPWPCVFKPRDGSRSLGLLRANGPRDVPPEIIKDPRYIWQERWVGREFTIHFFINQQGDPASGVIPCERIEVRDGEVSKGATRRIPALETAVRTLATALGKHKAYGPHCAQGIVRDDGKIALFEMNARFGGGYPLADDASATPFTRLLLQDAFGIRQDASNDWHPNRIMLRHDTAHFFDE
ncbi:MAG: hypothetical protein LBG65_05020 [Puniceicoccales bacterium]|jgi:carbamoyl-phosphate synthase large subunit|nr:hypothetical protein [Puniceicoccales bacterium]